MLSSLMVIVAQIRDIGTGVNLIDTEDTFSAQTSYDALISEVPVRTIIITGA